MPIYFYGREDFSDIALLLQIIGSVSVNVIFGQLFLKK